MSEPTRGDVAIYTEADGVFFGLGIRLGEASIIIRPDGTLVPMGASLGGKMVRRVTSTESRILLRQVAQIGNMLESAWQRCPEAMTVRLDVTIKTVAEPVITSVDTKENK